MAPSGRITPISLCCRLAGELKLPRERTANQRTCTVTQSAKDNNKNKNKHRKNERVVTGREGAGTTVERREANNEDRGREEKRREERGGHVLPRSPQ